MEVSSTKPGLDCDVIFSTHMHDEVGIRQDFAHYAHYGMIYDALFMFQPEHTRQILPIS